MREKLRKLIYGRISGLREGLVSPRFVSAVSCLALFTGLAFYYELVFQLLVGTIGTGIFRALFFCFIGAAIPAAATLTLPRRAAFIVSESVLSCVSLIYISQLLYSRIFQEFYSIDKITTGDDAITHFGGILVTTIRENVLAILLLLLPLAAIALLHRARRVPFGTRLPVKYALIPVTALIALRFLILAPVAGDPYSARAVRYGQGDSSLISSMREVGLFATMEIDLLSGYIETETSSVLKPYTPPPVILSPSSTPGSSNPADAFNSPGSSNPSDPSNPPSSSASASSESDPDAGPDTGGWPDSGAGSLNGDSSSGNPDDTTPAPPPIPDWVGKYNGFDVDFDALIERDKNDRGLVQLHEYFASMQPSSQNEKTGICEGYNLITISAEAFVHYFIDPDLTPTLYMMQQEGIYFNNFYALSGGGTIGGEVSLFSGLYPRGGEVWCKNAAQKYLPFSFVSQFKALGVQPIAYHNGSYTYYNRHTLLPDYGFDYRGRGHGLDFQGPGWHITDRLMVELSIDQYIDDDRFYVHYMTVSGHSPYDFEENAISYWNREAVQNLPFSPQVRAYIATQLELEYMLEYLIGRLEEKGIADRTIIAITPDHYPYGLAVRDITELAGGSLDAAFGLHKNACFIYVKGITPETVETPCFVPDVVPTVLNLLGLPFDSRFMAGRDVFSDALPLVYIDNGYVTDAGYYDRGRNKFIPNEGIEIPDGYVQAVSAIVDMKRSSAERIISQDYLAKIADYLRPHDENRGIGLSALDQ